MEADVKAMSEENALASTSLVLRLVVA